MTAGIWTRQGPAIGLPELIGDQGNSGAAHSSNSIHTDEPK